MRGHLKEPFFWPRGGGKEKMIGRKKKEKKTGGKKIKPQRTFPRQRDGTPTLVAREESRQRNTIPELKKTSPTLRTGASHQTGEKRNRKTTGGIRAGKSAID